MRRRSSSWALSSLPESPRSSLFNRFELLRVAMQLRKYAHFRAQQIRHHRNRKIIDRAALVAFQAVQIGKMHGRR